MVEVLERPGVMSEWWAGGWQCCVRREKGKGEEEGRATGGSGGELSVGGCGVGSGVCLPALLTNLACLYCLGGHLFPMARPPSRAVCPQGNINSVCH